MKEIQDIIIAYEVACRDGKQAALATVVQVGGSSYRKPGARMLVTIDGHTTGCVSGGCLEKDIVRKALIVMTTGKPMLATYDSTDEDGEEKKSPSLGCNGVIDIWIMPLKLNDPGNPVALLTDFLTRRKCAALVTFYGRSLAGGGIPASFLSFEDDGGKHIAEPEVDPEINDTVRDVFLLHHSLNTEVQLRNNTLGVFVEYMVPPIAILIVGAGNDAQPLAELCYLLGWQITIADSRLGFMSAARFPGVHKLVVARPFQICSQVQLDEHSVCVLMTHNYNHDLEMLQGLIGTDVPYIGVLGPSKKRRMLLQDLYTNGVGEDDPRLSKIFGPAGLDIGAENPEEIALSIVAEIKKVVSGHTGTMLRNKQTPIHARTI